MKTLIRLLAFTRPHRRLVSLAVLCMLLNILLNLLPPLILRVIIDEAIPLADLSRVWEMVVAFVVVNLSLGLVNYGQWYSFEVVGQNVARDLQLTLHNHLQRLHMEYFRKQRTGDVMSRLTEDIDSVHEFLGYGFILMVSNILSIVITLGVMFWLSWDLTLATAAAFPVLSVVVLRFDKEIRPLWEKVRAEMGKLTAALQENISGVRTVKAFAREDHEIGKFTEHNRRFLDSNIARIRVEGRTQPLVEFISSLTFAGLLWYGGAQVIAGNASLGTLVAFQGYVWNLVWPIRMLGSLINVFEEALAAAPRLFEVLDTVPAITDSQGALPAPTLQGKLEFRQVSFQFSDGEDNVLKDISFTVSPGQVLAIVGGTGSGKSTLVGLIPRFFDPQAGAVLIDGQDTRTMTLDSLRSQIGMVLQDTVLFSATIAENIAFGRPHAPQVEIEQAAQLAQAHDFISTLPNGYHTRIGERGVGLSGGQKQRIALARALLMNPRILILDEATSSVDVHTEYLIQEGLASVMQGRTSVIIAKRLSTIEQADYVLVMEQGQVVEYGTPRQLIDTPGYFSRMLAQQMSTAV
ncbi:MAG: putative multidrug export ATP-binding/permease protein [Firmicutes bacterium]|nr:putative multidrug export ATP-binding/permease protein [candidate division NPL-UPA2 bacterium]